MKQLDLSSIPQKYPTKTTRSVHESSTRVKSRSSVTSTTTTSTTTTASRSYSRDVTGLRPRPASAPRHRSAPSPAQRGSETRASQGALSHCAAVGNGQLGCSLDFQSDDACGERRVHLQPAGSGPGAVSSERLGLADGVTGWGLGRAGCRVVPDDWPEA